MAEKDASKAASPYEPHVAPPPRITSTDNGANSAVSGGQQFEQRATQNQAVH